MTWQLWIVFGIFIVNAVTQPLVVNQPRKPIDAETAAGIAAVNIILAVLVLWGS